MLIRISRNSKRIIAILTQHRKPTQVSLGIAIGIMLGLVPMDNLIVFTLLVGLICLRINQLAACCTAVAISLLGGWLNPIIGRIGTGLLDQLLVSDSIVTLYRFPILPWICLENPLVMGGVVVGLVTLLPSYVICRWSFNRAMQRLESIALEQVANDAIQYRKLVADQSKYRQEKPTPSLKLISEATDVEVSTNRSLISNSDAVDNNANAALAKVHLETEPIKSNGASFQRVERKIKQRTMPTIFTGEVVSDGNDTILRETVIEVVRYRRPISLPRVSTNTEQDSGADSQTPGTFMPVANTATKTSKDAANNSNALNKAVTVGQSIAFDSSHASSQANNRDESLRYLLWHINGSRESVRKSSEKTA